MAEFSAGPNISEYAPPSTAPVLDFPAGSLPEAPAVTDEQLREHARALARVWQVMSGNIEQQQRLCKQLEVFEDRLADLLERCRVRITSQELTPELELLENSRMMKTAITAASSMSDVFDSLPYVRDEAAQQLPRVLSAARGYLSAAAGIWSIHSLSVYVDEAQSHDPLLMAEVMAIPQALKLAQLEYILNVADQVLAAPEPVPIERSPLSALLHSLRRLNQAEWRDVLEPL